MITMKKNLYTSTLLMALIGLLLSSCQGKKGDAAEEAAADNAANENTVVLTKEQLNQAKLTLGRITPRNMSAVIRVKGKIDVPPQKMLSVSVPLGGYLQSTRLLPGMRVEKGDVIAVVTGEQYIQLQQDYLMAKEKQQLLELDYKRQRELVQSQSASQKSFQQVAAEYAAQQVLVQSLYQKLKLAGFAPESVNKDNISSGISVRSAISGYVAAVHVNIGKYLNPSDVLFEIISTDDIHLALTVFEKDIPLLRVAQEVFAFTNEQPQIRHRCRILLIGREIAENRSIEVHCHFDQEAVRLLPGTYMNAEVMVKNQQANVLPEEAILQYSNRKYVFVQIDSLHYSMREVQTGITENGYTVVSGAGITPADQVVIKGSYTLLMMLKNKQED
jgi:cobalt-zinc-cadmium efflux system membrane fusion protein